ncbi:hypothetical protein KCP73_17975 [Salmonella enterica subsp. enterica]|nr:hypothetical protein KCP73_17975 [Salmonella enterica subsp. enterica]
MLISHPAQAFIRCHTRASHRLTAGSRHRWVEFAEISITMAIILREVFTRRV